MNYGEQTTGVASGPCDVRRRLRSPLADQCVPTAQKRVRAPGEAITSRPLLMQATARLSSMPDRTCPREGTREGRGNADHEQHARRTTQASWHLIPERSSSMKATLYCLVHSIAAFRVFSRHLRLPHSANPAIAARSSAIPSPVALLLTATSGWAAGCARANACAASSFRPSAAGFTPSALVSTS
jgi:hypothetical protein